MTFSELALGARFSYIGKNGPDPNHRVRIKISNDKIEDKDTLPIWLMGRRINATQNH